jgi:hypothetical protein
VRAKGLDQGESGLGQERNRLGLFFSVANHGTAKEHTPRAGPLDAGAVAFNGGVIDRGVNALPSFSYDRFTFGSV